MPQRRAVLVSQPEGRSVPWRELGWQFAVEREGRGERWVLV